MYGHVVSIAGAYSQPFGIPLDSYTNGLESVHVRVAGLTASVSLQGKRVKLLEETMRKRNCALA